MKIGTIGIGSELQRSLVRSELEVIAVANATPSRLRDSLGYLPDSPVATSHLQLVRNPIVDAVVIAVDSGDRFFLVHEALKAGKHVLVDGQLASTLDEAAFLAVFARSQERVLLTSHPALRSEPLCGALSRLRASDARLHLLTSRRRWMGSVKRDVDALWDRVACDVAIFDLLADAHPTWVSSLATPAVEGANSDSLYLTLCYETSRGSVLAQIELSDGENGETDTISASADGLRLDILARDGGPIELQVNGETQPLPVTDPCVESFRHFAACVNGTEARIDPGLAVAHTLDAARRSLLARGRMTEI